MSDEEEYEYDSDAEESEGYEFEYSDDEGNGEDGGDANVDIENAYYDSKSNLEDGDVDAALDGFRSVLELEKEAGECSRVNQLSLVFSLFLLCVRCASRLCSALRFAVRCSLTPSLPRRPPPVIPRPCRRTQQVGLQGAP